MDAHNTVPEAVTKMYEVSYDVIYSTLSDLITGNGWDNCGDGINTSELAYAVYFELTGEKSENQLEREAEEADNEKD